jgi:hypothetical protein
MKTIKFDVTYAESAGRWELLVRILWSIPSYVVALVLGIICLVCWALQFLHILVFGKRNKFLYDWTLKYLKYYASWYSYLMLLTEERNQILPED